MAQEAADELVSKWFWDWVDYHIRVNPRSYWLPREEDFTFFSNWRRQFVLHGLHEVNDALDVSDRVSVLEIEEKSAFLPVLLQEFKNLLKERRDRFETEFGANLEAAQAAASGCLDCGGKSGFAIRWRHDSLKPGMSRYVTLYCLCAYGRAIRANHQKDDAAEAYRNRIPDLANYPFMHRDIVPWSAIPDNRYCYAPESWDKLNNRPIELPPGGLHALTAAPTQSVRDALRREPKSRAVLTGHQARFLGDMDPKLREFFRTIDGSDRAAALANFADDSRPFDEGAAERITKLLWSLELADTEARRERERLARETTVAVAGADADDAGRADG